MQNCYKEDSSIQRVASSLNILLFISILLIYVVLRLNLINIPLDRDEGIFAYVGQVINANGIPYKDAIDHKPPVVFFIYAFALKFMPPTPAGIHLFLHLYNLLTLFVLYFSVKIYSHSDTMALWTAFVYAVISTSPDFQGFTASAEMFMLLPISLSILFVFLATQKERFFYYFLSGFFGGLAFWTKQTGAFIILFIVLYAVCATVQKIHQKKKSTTNSVKDILWWGTGFVFITLMIAGYFFRHNSFNEFLYWSFEHSLIYSRQTNLLMMWPLISQSLTGFFKGNFMIIIPGIAGCLMMIKNKEQKGLWTLCFLLFSFFATCPGHAYPHYFAQLLPGLAITGGIGTIYLIQALSEKMKYPLSFILAFSIIFNPLFVHSDYYIKHSPEENSRFFFGFNPFPESLDLGKYIKEKTEKNDKIFIFGSEAQVLVYAQRKSATAFALIYPLMSSYPRYMEFQQQAWAEVQTNKPKYIILIKISTSLAYDKKANLWILEKTRELLSSEYEIEAVVSLSHPKGSIITIAEAGTSNDINNQNDYPIEIFRIKENK